MIKEYLDGILTDEQKQFIFWDTEMCTKLLNNLNRSVLNQEFAVGLPYYAEEDSKLVERFTYLAEKLKFGYSEVTGSYSRFYFNEGLLNPDKIKIWRIEQRAQRMFMRQDEKTYSNSLVKRKGQKHNDGLNRRGMMASAKLPFQLDTKMLQKYKRSIKQNLIKSIKKAIEKGHISKDYFHDEVSYTEIVDLAVEYYLDPSRTYNSEFNISDQRGRSIKNILKRVGNYISAKDFRAMLIVPKPYAKYITKEDTIELEDVYYFIAELLGHKCIGGTEQDKIKAGEQAYLNKELPRLNLKDEHGRKELHELIWLERIYNRLNVLFRYGKAYWDIPIEIDHSQSLGQIVGSIMNDENLLRKTSVIGDTISDPWKIEGVRRKANKYYGTPTFYGSSQSIRTLIKTNNYTFVQLLGDNPSKQELNKAKAKDKKEQKAIAEAYRKGPYYTLKGFKDLIIQNYNKKGLPVIHINTGLTQFDIHVNKMKQINTKTILTKVWSKGEWCYSFTQKPIMTEDYEAMTTFWVTALV